MNTDFLNPKFIRYFLRVADTGSLSAASKDLNVSQPSLTRAIQVIEENLQVKLFTRSKKGIELTEQGELFYLNAKSIKENEENIVLKFQQSTFNDNRENQIIVIGLACTLSENCKESLLWVIKKSEKNKQIRIIEKTSFELVELVEKKKIDYAIVSAPTFDDSIRNETLYSEKFVVAIYKGHRFEKEKEVDVQETYVEVDNKKYINRVGCEWYSYEFKHKDGDVDYKKVFKCIKDNEKSQDVVNTYHESTAALCVKAGLGIAVLPESLALNYGLIYRDLKGPRLAREVSLISNKAIKNSIGPSIDSLINAVQVQGL